jgi:O-methyltransferase
MILKSINFIINKWGYSIQKKNNPIPMDLIGETEFLKIYEQCRPYTQTSIERLYSLYQSCLYVIENKIEGDLVECGVWKGGSSMMMALTFLSKGFCDKTIYMYDTYEGMSAPTEHDVAIDGELAEKKLLIEDKGDDDSIWCFASMDEVAKNIYSTGYPTEKIKLVKGKVEETLLNDLPVKISLLRLDTDFYESTKMELEYLFPLLSEMGPLIIDDFGHWEGAKKAVLEYFEMLKIMPLLNRIDITGRILIKNG